MSPLMLFLLLMAIGSIRLVTFVWTWAVLRPLDNRNFIKSAIGMGLYVAVMPYLYVFFQEQIINFSMLWLIKVMFIEVLIGAALGILFSIPFLLITALGQFIDNQRGLVIEGPTNIVSREHSSEMEELLLILVSILFFYFEFHLVVLETTLNSYKFFAFGEPVAFGRAQLNFVLDQLGIFTYLVLGILPLLAIFLLADLSVGTMTRQAQGILHNEFVGAIKNAIMLVFLVIFGIVVLNEEGVRQLIATYSPFFPDVDAALRDAGQ